MQGRHVGHVREAWRVLTWPGHARLRALGCSGGGAPAMQSDKPFIMEVCTRTEADKKGGHLAVRKADSWALTIRGVSPSSSVMSV